MERRQPFDLATYVKRATTGPCFICQLLAGNPAYRHHIVAEDEATVIFLSRYPTLRGYCLVCPKAHLEDLAEDLGEADYLALQKRVYRLGRVLKRLFDAERIYVLSLGSRQANSHLHFHVVPLAEQQFHALMAENGVLAIPDAEMAAMAQQIGDAYRAL